MKKIVCYTGFIFFILFNFFSAIFLFAEISFTSADLNEAGDILFSVNTFSTNEYSYETLFLYSKQKNKIEQLTFFPEHLELLNNNKLLQISDKFGITRLELNTGAVYKQSEQNTGAAIHGINSVFVKSIQSSPDGKWITFVELSSHVYGTLVLTDTITDRKYILAEKTPADSFAVSWSPDSKTFLYEENGIIYFARSEWFEANTPPDKKFRQLAHGSIKSIKWISPAEFIFLDGNVLYQVNSGELFAKSFYLPLFPLGKMIARLPLEFEPATDIVSIAPDGKTILFVKSKRNVYLFKLNGDDYLDSQEEGVIPYLLLPGSTAEVSVYWKNNLPVLFSQGIIDGKLFLKGWQIFSQNGEFKRINIPENSVFLAGSSNFEIAAMREGDVVSFYDTGNFAGLENDKAKVNWKKLSSFYEEKIVSAVWKNSYTVILGGENFLYEYTFNKIKSLGSKKKICITSMKDFSWSDSGEKILVKTKSNHTEEIAEYAGAFNWKPSAETKIQQKKNTNTTERIYLDSSSGQFKNMVYIRSINNFTTKPLFEEPIKFAAAPQIKSETIYGNTSSIFSHGNRNGKKQLAFAFDAMSNMDGIAEVLYILKKNSIKASFFINGEALRQNPKAVAEIVKAGHQCGSLFFTTWNLSGNEYGIDENFIRQGLARNEDSFYAVTGRELSLIWHSPHYIASSMIINAGKKAGYIFISPDIRIPDWITSADKPEQSVFYKPPAEIIEDICASVSSGSIIPIRLGKTSPHGTDYLYLKLQLLIDSLAEMGYEFTDIDGLMKN